MMMWYFTLTELRSTLSVHTYSTSVIQDRHWALLSTAAHTTKPYKQTSCQSFKVSSVIFKLSVHTAVVLIGGFLLWETKSRRERRRTHHSETNKGKGHKRKRWPQRRRRNKKRKEGRRKEKDVWVSLTVAEECVFIVQRFGAVLAGRGRGQADGDEDMTVGTLLFSLFTLSFPLSSLLLLLLLHAKEARHRCG